MEENIGLEAGNEFIMVPDIDYRYNHRGGCMRSLKVKRSFIGFDSALDDSRKIFS